MAAATTDRGSKGRGTAAIAVAAGAVFLAVLALLALQLRANPGAVGLATRKPRVVVVRRVYVTTVHERIVGGTGTGATVSRSTASVAAPAVAASPAPTTRTS